MGKNSPFSFFYFSEKSFISFKEEFWFFISITQPYHLFGTNSTWTINLMLVWLYFDSRIDGISVMILFSLTFLIRSANLLLNFHTSSLEGFKKDYFYTQEYWCYWLVEWCCDCLFRLCFLYYFSPLSWNRNYKLQWIFILKQHSRLGQGMHTFIQKCWHSSAS